MIQNDLLVAEGDLESMCCDRCGSSLLWEYTDDGWLSSSCDCRHWSIIPRFYELQTDDLDEDEMDADPEEFEPFIDATPRYVDNDPEQFNKLTCKHCGKLLKWHQVDPGLDEYYAKCCKKNYSLSAAVLVFTGGV